MDVRHPQRHATTVRELVGHLARRHDDVATDSPYGLPADREGRLALVHDENLLIWVHMEAGSPSGRLIDHEERHGDPTVFGALEQAGRVRLPQGLDVREYGRGHIRRPPLLGELVIKGMILMGTP
jgi:hypothetical protein